MELMPGEQIGKFIISRHLGSGAFGSVYLARDILLDRQCAVKFVKNENTADFIAHYEAQILHRCQNDRIVKVFSVAPLQIQADLYAAIEMEYVSGGSAQALIETHHVSVRRAVKIVIDVLFALEHAHGEQILHRDVKPPNIMLAANHSKLSDFGLARDVAGALFGSGAGSPVYCAPEVLNRNITTAQTDIFSAGMSLFQLVNNYSDFGSSLTASDIAEGRTINKMGYQSYVPRRLRTVCSKAAAYQPARRYSSAHQMRQALEGLHIRQDWGKVGKRHWTACIGGQQHEMAVENRGSNELVYRVNGRRKNANCKTFSSLREASEAQRRWIYDNTF